MYPLIKNEMIKIFKRKNIYLLLILAIVIMLGYNFYEKYRNIDRNIDITKQYKKAYQQDNLYLDHSKNSNSEEEYSNIVERIALEKYAIENNIQYNILLNSENKNIEFPTDARILFMRLFQNFEMIIIIIILYISSTIISEEYSSGTIKNLLVKPHKRTTLLLSKLITSLSAILIVSLFIIIFQFIVGGLVFSFDSYHLEAIRYNPITENVDTMNLFYYMMLTFLYKTPLYLLITLISILIGITINNIAINILLSLGMYFLSNVKVLTDKFTFDISKYLFGGITNVSIKQAIIIISIIILILFILSIQLFKKKDIKNE